MPTLTLTPGRASALRWDQNLIAFVDRVDQAEHLRLRVVGPRIDEETTAPLAPLPEPQPIRIAGWEMHLAWLSRDTAGRIDKLTLVAGRQGQAS